MAQIVTLHVEPYGDFKVALRDMMTEMRISCRADEQITKQGFDPRTMGHETRGLFTAMATFFETCEEGGTPDSFDAGKLMRGGMAEGMQFFMDYMQALGDAEARFREGVQDVVPAKPVERRADASVEGTQDSAVG